MGTNYYVRYNRCDCCGRYDELHMCKSFRTYQAHWDLPHINPVGQITSVSDWLKLLEMPGVEVWDEYGDQHDPVEVRARISDSRAASSDEYAKALEFHAQHQLSWLSHDGYRDPDGYYLLKTDFS